MYAELSQAAERINPVAETFSGPAPATSVILPLVALYSIALVGALYLQLRPLPRRRRRRGLDATRPRLDPTKIETPAALYENQSPRRSSDEIAPGDTTIVFTLAAVALLMFAISSDDDALRSKVVLGVVIGAFLCLHMENASVPIYRPSIFDAKPIDPTKTPRPIRSTLHRRPESNWSESIWVAAACLVAAVAAFAAIRSAGSIEGLLSTDALFAHDDLEGQFALVMFVLFVSLFAGAPLIDRLTGGASACTPHRKKLAR